MRDRRERSLKGMRSNGLPMFATGVLWLSSLLPGLPGHAQAVDPDPALMQTPSVELLPPLEQVPETEPPSVTLEELRNLAVSRSPAIAEARARVAALRGAWVQAGLRANPTVGYVGDEIGNSGSAGMQGGSLQQRIITGSKRQFRRGVVAQQIARAEQLLAARTLQVVNDVRTEYYNALVARQRVQVLTQIEQIAASSVDVARRLLEAKEGTRLSVLQATTEFHTAQANREAAVALASAARRRLIAVAAVPELTDFSLVGDPTSGIPRIEQQAALERLLTQSPQLAAAFAGVDQARAALASARAGRVPDITTQASVQYNYETGSTMAGVTLQVPLQLYDRNQGNIYRANAELVAARATADRAQLDLARQLADTYGRYLAALRQVTQYEREILPNAKEAWDLVARGFAQGEVDYLTVLTAQRTYFQANLVYLDVVQQAWQTAIQIDGLLLTGSLQNLNGYQ